MPSSTSTATSSAATSSQTSNSSTGGGESSPLLFFVALGFGVVFTNLWIIVGVKYCFRYNQRNRQRLNGDDPDGVDLGALPRQHRRRREKKLMTMEEVNEKFPLTKYKTWRSSRAKEGLPTAGGIANTTTSRPASIHHEKRQSKEVADGDEATQVESVADSEEKAVGSEALATNSESQPESTTQSPSTAEPIVQRPTTSQSNKIPPDSPMKAVTTNDDEADDDDQIQTAVPPEQLPDPGDTCAICIDTIEDEDDIRGLHCGHAFHASCVDPWLTSRRACCPLCKADYYVPKPRPEGAEADDARRRGTRGEGSGVNILAPPQFSTMPRGRGGSAYPPARRPTMVLPGRFMTIVYDDRDRYGFPRVVREPRPSRSERQRSRQLSAATTAAGSDSAALSTERNQSTPSEQPAQRTWRQKLGGVRIPNPIANLRGQRDQGNLNTDATSNSTTTPEAVTPAQLEAGHSTS